MARDVSRPDDTAEERLARALALIRQLCIMFDAGGESMRSIRSRLAEAAFQQLQFDADPALKEAAFRQCDAAPVEFLESIIFDRAAPLREASR
jgi:hypothetical protein